MYPYITLILAGTSLLFAPLIYIWRDLVSRVERLEADVRDNLVKKEEINDKLEPIKDDLSDIKVRIDKILDKLIDKS